MENDGQVLGEQIPDTTDSSVDEGADLIPDAAMMEEIKADPRLSAVLKAMNAGHTQRSQKLSRDSQATEIIRKFNSDPEFAKQTIMERAGQIGLTIGGVPPDGKPATNLEITRAALPEDTKFLAESILPAVEALLQEKLKPYEQKQAQDLSVRQSEAYEVMKDSMNKDFPGWESKEDEMLEALTYIRSGRTDHPKFGNMLKIVHGIVAGPGPARVAALRDTARAARNRTGTSVASSKVNDNLESKIMGAKTMGASWAVAKDAALKEADDLGLEV